MGSHSCGEVHKIPDWVYRSEPRPGYALYRNCVPEPGTRVRLTTAATDDVYNPTWMWVHESGETNGWVRLVGYVVTTGEYRAVWARLAHLLTECPDYYPGTPQP